MSSRSCIRTSPRSLSRMTPTVVRLGSTLLGDGPVVVTAIAGCGEEITPASWVEVGQRSQLPALEIGALLVGEPRIDLDIGMAAADALDFGQRALAAIDGQVMDGVDGDHQVERAGWEGQGVGRGADTVRTYIVQRVIERILRDVEAVRAEPR